MSEHTHEWRCPEVTWGDAPRGVVAVCEDCHLEAVYVPEARLAEAEADAKRLYEKGKALRGPDRLTPAKEEALDEFEKALQDHEARKVR